MLPECKKKKKSLGWRIRKRSQALLQGEIITIKLNTLATFDKSSSPEPLGQFQANSALSIPFCREITFVLTFQREIITTWWKKTLEDFITNYNHFILKREISISFDQDCSLLITISLVDDVAHGPHVKIVILTLLWLIISPLLKHYR